MKSFLIGIAGPSCSGKSELASYLLEQFGERGAVVISLDSYYHDLTPLNSEERDHWNFDVPGALDRKLLIENVTQLSNGDSIEKPIYQFPSHTRAERGEIVNPFRVIIVEGLFALYWEEIRDLLNLKVFIDTNDEVCLERRKQRDVIQRNRSEESVVRQYNETVRPMYRKYIRPTSEFADLILDGMEPIRKSGEVVKQKMNDTDEQ